MDADRLLALRDERAQHQLAADRVREEIYREIRLLPPDVDKRAVERASGVSRTTVYRLLNERDAAGHQTLVPQADPALFTYRELVATIAGGEDWRMAARLLREVVLRAAAVTDAVAVDEIHRNPGSTGIRGWDAIVAGVASMTGRGRVSDPEILGWCFAADRYVTDSVFDPFANAPKYFWLDYLRTPVELAVRNVVFPSGNLEGV